MKKALITGKTNVDNLQDIFLSLQQELKALDIESFIVDPMESHSSEFDVVFSIGGDGSFISAARKYAYAQKPIVAVKGGTIGFLTNIHPKDFKDELPKIINSDYPWMKRMILTGQTQTSNQIIALNEFIFSNDKKGSLCNFTICINDEEIMRTRADGVLFATPTGSTAYNLSAGGPISLPDMELLTITPICSHILGERPLVIDLKNKIQIINNSSQTSKVWSDGQDSVEFNTNDVFTIGKPIYIKSLHTSSKDFFNTLSYKLGWKKF